MTGPSGEPPRLQVLHLVVTSACNLGCSYCYQRQRSGASMSGEVLRAALELLLEIGAGAPVVSFHGGEPLLELGVVMGAVERLEAHRAAGLAPRYVLTTNGTLLDDRTAVFLERHRVRTVLSFDGVREAQDLRAPGTFAQLDRTLGSLAVCHPRLFREQLTVAVTLTSSNVGYLGRSVAYLLGKGVRSIEIAPLLTHDPGWGPATRHELDRQLAQAGRISRDHLVGTGEVPLKLLRRFRGEERAPVEPRSGCGAPSGAKLAVDVDGRASSCVLFVESCQRLPEGLTSALADLFHLGRVGDPELPARLRDLPDRVRASGLCPDPRDRHSSSGRCRDCRFVDRCSVCPLSVGHVPGGFDPRRVPDHVCDFQSLALEHRERFPALTHPLDLLRGLSGAGLGGRRPPEA